jgi:uncharacterized protein YfaS (alpha-2-macroglobulin family)
MLVVAALACQIGGPPAIGEVVVAKSLDADYKPVDPTTTYTTDDPVISISVEVQNMVVGSVVDVKYKVDGVDYESLTSTADESGSGYYGFTLTAESGHTPGAYTAEVYLDGALAKTVTFKIEPSGPPTIVAAVAAKSLDDDYKPVDPTSTYAPSETFYISVQVKNMMSGSNVTVKYAYEGEFVPELDTTVIADKAGSGYYGFNLTPPTDGFPVGAYTAEVYLDGALATTLTFTVQ